MSHAKKPHTIIAYTRAGKAETIGRPGHLTGPQVTAMLARRGVTGEVVIRHHAPAMFGKAGETVAVVRTEVRAS